MLMKNMVLGVMVLMPVMAGAAVDECLMYKTIPNVKIINPQYTKSVAQPEAEMNKNHGTVEATFVDNYDIIASVSPLTVGYCVVLKSVNATIGFSEFQVNIDARNVPDSCEYNAVLAHEDLHINSYLSIIDDFKDKFYDTVQTAAKSVMPVYIRRADDVDLAIEKLNAELQAHPDIVLMRQQIETEEELRSNKIDLDEENNLLKQCKSEN